MKKPNYFYSYILLYLFAGVPADGQTVFAEDDLGKAALAAEGLFPDGIELADGFPVVVKEPGVQLSVFHENLIHTELGVFGMLIFAAQGF